MLNVDLRIGALDGQAVVALCGESNRADAPGLASHLIAAVAACGPSVIVDLTGLENIDYSGLSVLLRIRKWTRQSGGDLPLAAPQQPVRQVLEATGLIDVFSVYPSVEEAAISLTKTAPAPAPAPPAVVGRAAAASCRHGHPAGRPAAGMLHCRHSLIRLRLGAERADCGIWRVTPALNGARREGQPHGQRGSECS
jgi:anti-sigma B factor antagonist